MRSCLVILLFFSVVSLVCISEAARHGPEDYWKKIMQDEQMPKALTDLFHEDSSRSDDHHHRRHSDINVQKQPETLNMKRFLTNFDTAPNLIIYQNKVVIH
ncbi:uncharacterized protein LOC113773397 isoform X3 [Coffea eugenioides]|uniref:uncharacterized protein LOC113763675 isoform X3 n=1 Tax=Coffea eugenioides TaxID=49369 RepID=UPI000F5C8859|nr:uncharacterized protein LOC113726334 [Coffea arabica]XP_027112288.1 uncharacterized protein LOC113731305 [Coffea arabica]XP_027163372.1 uncharacterized protein LOC113763675 isoform X3 [Coffea eugenioides]XP_027173834.1 uncharacterized protein LOC113773396 isoform X3 [Coffea eugenioides]XP_027173838.1 uncharacterized protein LOC113773397 isoform X3 [Coffea eugenioides]